MFNPGHRQVWLPSQAYIVLQWFLICYKNITTRIETCTLNVNRTCHCFFLNVSYVSGMWLRHIWFWAAEGLRVQTLYMIHVMISEEARVEKNKLNWASFLVLRHAAFVGTIIALSSTALHLPPALSVKLYKRVMEEGEKHVFVGPLFSCLFIQWGNLLIHPGWPTIPLNSLNASR